MTSEDTDMDALYKDESKPEKKPVKKPGSIDEQEQDEAAQLMDKKSFPDGCEVGKRYSIEVTADNGEDVTVKVVGAADKPEETKPEPDTDDELESMNKEF